MSSHHIDKEKQTNKKTLNICFYKFRYSKYASEEEKPIKQLPVITMWMSYFTYIMEIIGPVFSHCIFESMCMKNVWPMKMYIIEMEC